MQISNKSEPDRPQRDHARPCVIAQQYSSATVISLRLNWARLKSCSFILFYYLN
jgi:hypothetical protein